MKAGVVVKITAFFFLLLSSGGGFALASGTYKDCATLVQKIKPKLDKVLRLNPSVPVEGVDFWFSALNQSIVETWKSEKKLLNRKLPSAWPRFTWLETAIKQRLEYLRSLPKTQNSYSHFEGQNKFENHLSNSDIASTIVRHEHSLVWIYKIFSKIKRDDLTYGIWLQLVELGFKALSLGLYEFEPTDDGPLNVKRVVCDAYEHTDRTWLLFSDPPPETKLLKNPNFAYMIVHSPFHISWPIGQDDVSFAGFNTLGALPINLFGIMERHDFADGLLYDPEGFATHDAGHNQRVLKNSAVFRKPRNSYYRLTELFRSLNELDSMLDFEIARLEFFSKQKPKIRYVMEVVYFWIWHELEQRPSPQVVLNYSSGPWRQQSIQTIIRRANNGEFGPLDIELVKPAMSKLRDFSREFLGSD